MSILLTVGTRVEVSHRCELPIRYERRLRSPQSNRSGNELFRKEGDVDGPNRDRGTKLVSTSRELGGGCVSFEDTPVPGPPV